MFAGFVEKKKESVINGPAQFTPMSFKGQLQMSVVYKPPSL